MMKIPNKPARYPMRLLSFLMVMLCAQAAHSAEKIAFFGMQLLDDSMQTAVQGDNNAEQARIVMLNELVQQAFSEHGYELVDMSPVQDDLDKVLNPAKCNQCDTKMAAELGADYALVGEVQKVSNLILSMNLQLRDTATGQTVKGRVVDIRGNTDQSWAHGMRYILKYSFFNEGEK